MPIDSAKGLLIQNDFQIKRRIILQNGDSWVKINHLHIYAFPAPHYFLLAPVPTFKSDVWVPRTKLRTVPTSVPRIIIQTVCSTFELHLIFISI